MTEHITVFSLIIICSKGKVTAELHQSPQLNISIVVLSTSMYVWVCNFHLLYSINQQEVRLLIFKPWFIGKKLL